MYIEKMEKEYEICEKEKKCVCNWITSLYSRN